ncbi:hypothetical protein N7540_006518 [Penicillium herquei]|nr:hypothetical protein N7540_006518 [Penicillium herquei]
MNVSSFSQVNRAFYRAAVPFLYRDLIIKFWDRQSLKDAVAEVLESRKGQLYSEYARKLKIICLKPPTGVACQREQTAAWKKTRWATDLIEYEAHATRETFLEPFLTDPYPFFGTSLQLNETGTYYERDWEPVTTLLAHLKHLKQFDFIAHNAFSAQLQHAISKHHPKCQLNIWSDQPVGWSIPGLKHKAKGLLDSSSELYDFDFDVLNMPALRTLTLNLAYRTTLVDDTLHREPLNEVIPFLFAPPNLKHLIIHGATDDCSYPLQKEWEKLRIPKPSMPRSSVESLSISLLNMSEDILVNLTNHMDLSRLHSLEIDNIRDMPALSRTAHLFIGLKRLFINLSTLGSGLGIPRGAVRRKAVKAIQAFTPLKYLRLRSLHLAEELHRIVEYHGESLKGLIIEPDIRWIGRDSLSRKSALMLEASDLHQLVQACPELEELRVQIRKPTDHQNMEIYKTLGNFPKLKSLVLDINYNPAPDFGILIGVQARLLLMNAAREKELALRIWDLIKSSQKADLQHLRIIPFGIMRHKEGLSHCFGFLARSFLVTRGSDLGFPQPILEEVGYNERRIWMEEYRISREDTNGETDLDSDPSDSAGLETMTVRSLFREMWPSATFDENGPF